MSREVVKVQLWLRDSVFQPLPAGDLAYVPVLQDKSGEREALTHLTESDWLRVTPVLCIVGPQSSPDELTDTRVREWARKTHVATRGRPFYADMVRLSPDTPVTVGPDRVPVVARLYERLRSRGSTFVPVYRDRWRSQTAAQAARDAHDRDGRGAALRLSLDSGVAGTAPPLDRVTSAWRWMEIEAEEIDLMIDLGCLDWDGDPDVDGICSTLSELGTAAAWRNIILLGTTIPRSFSKAVAPPGAMTTLPRHERQVYRELRRMASDLPLRFGDFAVQHPDPPVEGGGPSMRSNIRYTTPGGTLVARGIRPYGEVGNAEYPTLCGLLRTDPAFEGTEFSWGDRIINACAEGALRPGGQSMWRGAGTSHHIRHILRELALRDS